MEEPVPSQLTTPVDALRAHLDMLEHQIEQITPGNVEEILVTLDAASAEMGILEESQASNAENGDTDEGVDGVAGVEGVNRDEIVDDRERWDAILIALRARPQLISVPARGFPGGMAALREKHRPATGFWWSADKLRADKQRNQLIRAIVLLLLAAAMIYGVAWLWSNYSAAVPAIALLRRLSL